MDLAAPKRLYGQINYSEHQPLTSKYRLDASADQAARANWNQSAADEYRLNLNGPTTQKQVNQSFNFMSMMTDNEDSPRRKA